MRDSPMHQQVWVLEGTIEVTVGDDVHLLDAGDCLALVLEAPVIYHNPTARAGPLRRRDRKRSRAAEVT